MDGYFQHHKFQIGQHEYFEAFKMDWCLFGLQSYFFLQFCEKPLRRVLIWILRCGCCSFQIHEMSPHTWPESSIYPLNLNGCSLKHYIMEFFHAAVAVFLSDLYRTPVECCMVAIGNTALSNFSVVALLVLSIGMFHEVGSVLQAWNGWFHSNNAIMRECFISG